MGSSVVLAINAIVYCLMFSFLIKSKKSLLSTICVALYAIISVACFFFEKTGAFISKDLYLWPYIYYFGIFIIFIYPFSKIGNLATKFKIKNVRAMNFLSDIYILASIFFFITVASQVITTIRSGNFFSAYILMRGEDAVYYTNFIGQLSINIVNYLKIPITAYGFYAYVNMISYKRKSLALILPFVNSIIWGIYLASRTDFFIAVILYATFFLIFRDYFNRRTKKIITFAIILFGSLAALSVFMISASRFGSGETEWFSEYFGESFITAHHKIANTIQYSDGSYFFRYFYEFFNIPTKAQICSVDIGYAFITLIGARYSDFGFWGTILFALIVCSVFTNIFRKKTYGIITVYVIIYYFQDILMGVYYDSTNAISWVVVGIFSLFIFSIKKIIK